MTTQLAARHPGFTADSSLARPRGRYGAFLRAGGPDVLPSAAVLPATGYALRSSTSFGRPDPKCVADCGKAAAACAAACWAGIAGGGVAVWVCRAACFAAGAACSSGCYPLFPKDVFTRS